MDISQITPESLRATGLKKWTEYPGTVGMWVAESDFGVAPVIQTAIEDAVARRGYGYLETAAADEAKAACANWYRSRYGFDIPPANVRLVGDVLTGLEATVRHFVPDGAPIIIPTPAYMPFIPLAEALGHPVVQVPLVITPGDVPAWTMDIEAIAAALTPGSLFILCNPHNPTGRVYRRDELAELSAVIEAAGARVFSDEIHAPLVLTTAAHTPYASVSDEAARHTITATSASKAWNMPGLKCAQLIFTNPADAAAFDATGGWESFTTGTLGVVANTAAYRHGQEWLSEFVAVVDANMAALEQHVAQLLPKASFIRPEGTYLAWIDVNAYQLPNPVDAFLRTEANVAVTDGRHCGAAGAGFIRMCMATTPAIAAEAIERIATAITRADSARPRAMRSNLSRLPTPNRPKTQNHVESQP